MIKLLAIALILPVLFSRCVIEAGRGMKKAAQEELSGFFRVLKNQRRI